MQLMQFFLFLSIVFLTSCSSVNNEVLEKLQCDTPAGDTVTQLERCSLSECDVAAWTCSDGVATCSCIVDDAGAADTGRSDAGTDMTETDAQTDSIASNDAGADTNNDAGADVGPDLR